MSKMQKCLTGFLWAVLAVLTAGGGVPPEIERPPQPFLVELLAQERGRWKFESPVGQELAHPGRVGLYAAGAGIADRVGLLLENPEFPGDRSRAEWKEIAPEPDGSGFLIREPNFSMRLRLQPGKDGEIPAELSEIRLGPAPAGRWNFTGLYLRVGGSYRPLELTGPNGSFKLQTGRVGSVFKAGEPVELIAVRRVPAPRRATLILRDYYSGAELSRRPVELAGRVVKLPVEPGRFGSFEAELLTADGCSAKLRLTRIPAPEKVAHEKSFMGINVFQQQHWYYSYQLPLFAAAGIRWVRPWLHWENTWKMQEPERGRFDTSALDAMLRRLALHDQKLEYIFYNYAPWLVPGRSTEMTPLDAEQMKLWEAYVGRIVRHCSPQVTDYEVWNEPDLLAGHNPAFSAGFYAKLTRRTAAAVRAANPAAKIHTLSHANVREWLEAAGDAGVAASTDVVTLHTYAPAEYFVRRELARQKLLDCGGFFGKPQYFNEIGAAGYDGCPEYSGAFPGTSEKRQAEQLVINYAQAMHFAGAEGKVFYFCSLDPRDSRDPSGRTWDSSIGLLYLGLQPKTAFASLAATAKLLDGRTCLGRVEVNDAVRYVAFSGGRAVVWSDVPGVSVKASELGCAPGEAIGVFDLFANPVASGRAEDMTIDLSRGPVFLTGSETPGRRAAAERNAWMAERGRVAAAERQVGRVRPVAMTRNSTAEAAFRIPAGSRVEVRVPEGFPAAVEEEAPDGLFRLKLRAGDSSGAGAIRCIVTLPDASLPAVVRTIPVMVDRTTLVEDGAFDNGSLDEYQLAGPEMFDPAEGAMRLNGPFGSRTHLHCRPPYRSDRPLHFSVRLRGRLSPGVKLSFNVAFFREGWLGTWSPAAHGENSIASEAFRDRSSAIPEELAEWTTVKAVLPAGILNAPEARAIFFLDIRGGRPGDAIWIDNLELYQEREAVK